MRLAIGKPKLKGPRPGPRKELPKPSLFQQARNFAGAVVRDVAAGNPRRTGEEIANILRICRGEASTPCTFYRPSDETCAACGCPLRRKAAWLQEHCPRGYW